MKLYVVRDYFESIRGPLAAIGVFVLTVSNCAHVIGVWYPGFILTLWLVLIVGVLLILIGLFKFRLSIDKIWARALSAIYFSIILFAGLRSGTFNDTYYKIFLDMAEFNCPDLLLNTVGFIPLGFLLMLSFRDRSNYKKTLAVAGVGTIVSLVIETSQYYFIHGRVSSMIDLVTNIIGTLIGIALYLVVEEKRVQKQPSAFSIQLSGKRLITKSEIWKIRNLHIPCLIPAKRD